jgi:hypothetical protein
MDKNTTRLAAVAGTTMALVVAATATVAAAGPRDRGFGQDEFGFGGRMGPGMELGRGFGGLRGMDEDFERREVTVQTADGTLSSRVEQGTLASADEASLTFSLANGEAVTVTLDEDSQVVGFEEQEEAFGEWSRTRLAPTEIAAADLQAGSEIVVWSESEDGGDWVASRVVVTPADEAIEDDASATDEATDDTAPEATEDAATEDAATDA